MKKLTPPWKENPAAPEKFYNLGESYVDEIKECSEEETEVSKTVEEKDIKNDDPYTQILKNL